MIVDIIPTKKMPKNLSILSYQVSSNFKKLNIGQLVNIPLKNSNIIGVINSIYKYKYFPYPLKNINSIVHLKPIFTINQLNLFNNLAQYYQVSSSLFVHYNLPKLIKKDWDKLPQIINKSTPKNRAKNNFLWWTSFKQKQKKYLNYITQAQKKNAQILFIVPQINDIEKLINQLNITTNIVTIHHKKTRQENIKNWFQAIKPNFKIFIGTRSALFYPYLNLDTIIIDDEHSINHKQTDMNPRYETKIVAQYMNCRQIIFSSNSPSIESYYNFKLTPPNYNKKNIHIINNANVLINKNYTFISDNLNNKIKTTLKQKKSIFLFINKKGEASVTSCLDCGYTFKCPHCKLPLIKTKHKLTCYHCNHTEDIPPFCPHCTGPNFKSAGLGIQKIETNIKKLFPKANIIILDKQHTKKSINQQQTTIYIGTEFALDKINWLSINLIGIINADQLWHHIEYNSIEQAYNLLIKILTLSHKNANIVIQTFNPNHYIIKSLINNNPILFYKQELLLRKQFNYPPFTNLIKLSYLHTNLKKTEDTTNKLYQKLKQINTKANINPPLQILHNKVRNKYKYNIIIKIYSLKELQPLIKLVPHDWLIDIHPKTLLN